MHVWLDCQAVVKDFQAGSAHCLRAAHPAVDLWQQVWEIVGSACFSIRLSWCKGHARQHHLDRGLTTEFHMQGNANADYYASVASAKAEQVAPAGHLVEQHRQAQAWYK